MLNHPAFFTRDNWLVFIRKAYVSEYVMCNHWFQYCSIFQEAVQSIEYVQSQDLVHYKGACKASLLSAAFILHFFCVL